MRVRLYRNLNIHNQRAWSLMAMDGPYKGKVRDPANRPWHVDGAVLRDVTFVVNEGGRRRVGLTGHRNVHAFVDGTLLETFALRSGIAPSSGSLVRVTYDPRTMTQFIRTDCAQDVYESDLVIVTPEGVFARLPPCVGTRSRGLQGLSRVSWRDNWNG